MYRKFQRLLQMLLRSTASLPRQLLPKTQDKPGPSIEYQLEDIQVVYHRERLRSVVYYAPLNIPQASMKAFASEIDLVQLCRRFRPKDAKIVITLMAMEEHLDLYDKTQALRFVTYIKRVHPLLGCEQMVA